MAKALKHFGVLGMRWGKRKSPQQIQRERGRQGLIDEANKILNNPKSSQADLDKAHSMIGIDPKTGRLMRTKAVYDKDGNDISVRPYKRLFKEPGQSDKDFDAIVDAEMNPPKEKMVGKPVKTLFGVRTEAVYDASGKDISSKPFGRPFKKKGQSDKDYDAEIDEENSDSPDAIAKRKAADIQMDKQAKIEMGVTLAVAGTATVVMLAGMKQLQKAADARLVEKYGPLVADLIKKGSFS
jgi:hypothetical protein